MLKTRLLSLICSFSAKLFEDNREGRIAFFLTPKRKRLNCLRYQTQLHSKKNPSKQYILSFQIALYPVGRPGRHVLRSVTEVDSID